MGKTIKYVGPEDELESSDYLVVGGFVLPRGKAVTVSDEVAKAAADFEGHEVKNVTGDEAKDAPAAQPTVVNPDEPDENAEPAKPNAAAPGAGNES